MSVIYLSHKKLIAILALSFVALSLFPGANASAAVWYVDRDNHSSLQDGLTWPSAFPTLQAAIDAASTAGGGDIWIAEGVYNEHRTYIEPESSRNLGSLLMREGVALYGGFAGNETLIDQRNTLRHRTIIDGSKARGGEAAYQVIIGASGTVIDGVEITGGDAGFRRQIGGGLRVEHLHDVRIANCLFTGNTARFGAALRITFSSNVTVERCRFTENTSNGVGIPAIYMADSLVNIIDSSFVANEYDGDNFDGGCVRAEGGSVLIARCLFSRNTGTPVHLEADDGGAHEVRACDFVNNNGRDGSGGLRYSANDGAGQFAIDRCNFIGNDGTGPVLRIRETGERIPGTHDFARYLDVENSSFVNNYRDASQDPVVLVGGANYIFEHCTFAGNQCKTSVILHTADPNEECQEQRLRVRNSIFWNAPSPAEIEPVTNSLTPPAIEDTIVRGGYTGNDIYNAEPQFLDLAFGDFRLDPASPGVDQAQIFNAVPHDVFGSVRPSGLAPDLGAHEVAAVLPTLCDSAEVIETRLAQFPFMADTFDDLDHDGLPEIASLRLLAFAACPHFSSLGHATESAFAQNLGSADTEPFDTQILRRDGMVAAMMSVSASLQTTLRDAFAEMGVVLFNDYSIVGCDATGEHCAATAPGTDPAVNEAASGPGDFDGDGMTNAEEWAALIADHGTLDEYVAAATNPRVLGTPPPYSIGGSSGGGGGGCFIATAAYGTAMSDELYVLRAARDQHLLTNPFGAAFTDSYYRISPPIADFIAQHDTLRAAVRRVLSPIIALARWFNGAETTKD